VSSWFEDLPDAVTSLVLQAAGIPPETMGGKLERKARNRLVEVVKGLPLEIVRAVPLEKGEVVAGGVSLDEVDPHSMKSRVVEGLWLCGEVLDIAGPVGGYNLQAAWSTGYVAGESAAGPP
jgi:predicted flavoprotein YhiN